MNGNGDVEGAGDSAAPPVSAGAIGAGARGGWAVKIGAMAVLQGIFSLLLLGALGYGLAHEEAGRTAGPVRSSALVESAAEESVTYESVYYELAGPSLRDSLFLGAAGIVAILALAAGIAMLSRSRRARAIVIAWLVAGLAMVPATVVWLVMTGPGGGGRGEEGGAAGIVLGMVLGIIGIVMLAAWYAGLPAAALVMERRIRGRRSSSAS